jgi:hypothetical protein
MKKNQFFEESIFWSCQLTSPKKNSLNKKVYFCNFKNGFLFCGEFFFGLANFQDQKKHSLKVEKTKINWSEVTSKKMMSKVMRRKKNPPSSKPFAQQKQKNN